MRRNEFEVKDLQEIRAFLQHCQVCRLALCDGGQPYLIPLSYGMHFDKTGNLTTLYFHSAQEGKKLSFLSANPQVCFEMDDYVQIIPSTQACGFSMRYASIIGSGRATLIEDQREASGPCFPHGPLCSKSALAISFARTTKNLCILRCCEKSFFQKTHLTGLEDCW